jgi:2-polyprenyl-3-methyl-5-hydroxy-6-metoxy-1,4-benzoquinol methylase
LQRRLLDLFRCPHCQAGLVLTASPETNGEVDRGELDCAGCARRYPIIESVPRFVPAENYAESFGWQWNRFRRTQLDSCSGRPISRGRFFRQSGWPSAALAGRRVLDVGCGAGRFAEVALACGAEVVAVDYSSAADACWRNLGPNANLSVVQADVYQLPFAPGQFDFVYCFGVLQHTPDVKSAFLALPAQLRDGGRLAVDIYPKQMRNVLWPKYWLRHVTKHVPPPRLFRLVQTALPILWPISLAVGRVPVVGRKLRYAIPVANYEGIYPLSPAQLREWALLDTFDMLAPAHDSPQSVATLAAWFALARLRDVEVFRDGLLIGRGTK